MKSSSKMKKNDDASGDSRKWRRFILPACLLAIVAAAWICSRFWLQLMLIQGPSMEPAYHSFQPVLLDRSADTFRKGEVVAFHSRNVRTLVVKRIAACPGDRVLIRDGVLMVNGVCSPAGPGYRPISDPGVAAEELVLPPDCYFMLGDNTEHSTDSRSEEIGLVYLNDIAGRILPQKAKK